MILAAAWNKLVIQLCTRHTSHENPIKKSFANPKTTCDYVVGHTQIDNIRFVTNKLEEFCCFLNT
jgi:hypothetical protein